MEARFAEIFLEQTEQKRKNVCLSGKMEKPKPKKESYQRG
jgi:hypothetical protein